MLFLLAACAIGTLAHTDTGNPTGACTEIGCVDGFVISLVSSTWNEGSYEFQIQVDDALTTCNYTIPLGTSDQGGCDADDVLMGLGGDDSFYEIDVTSTTASSVTVTIMLDGAQLDQETFTPDYQQLQPNGEGCPPVCTYDGESMIVD